MISYARQIRIPPIVIGDRVMLKKPGGGSAKGKVIAIYLTFLTVECDDGATRLTNRLRAQKI
jgi:hypothetical protein